VAHIAVVSFHPGTICSRLTDEGRISISAAPDQTSGTSRTEQQLASDDDLLAAYRDHFGIVLSQVPGRRA
jgi:N-hydroxyarylamine O-acetyltransferase